MNRPFFSLFTVLLVGSFLSACVNNVDDAILSREGESCSRTADCEQGLRCVDLKCILESDARSEDTGNEPLQIDAVEMFDGGTGEDAWSDEPEVTETSDNDLAEMTYTVSYDGNGNTGGEVPTDANMYRAGAEVTVQDNTGGLVKTGFVFSNWNTSPDGSGQTYEASSILLIGDENVVLFAVWKDPYWTVGNGTAESPYSVTSAEDLSYLASSVNSGQNYTGVYFRMASDINLNYQAWTPIGRAGGVCFSGNFDGDGHSVSNLYSSVTSGYVGLFGCISNATITSLGVTGDGEVKCKSSGTCYAGSIIGYAKASAITGCFNQSPVSGQARGNDFPDFFAGGIVGYATQSIITGCSNSGSIDGSAASLTGASSSSNRAYARVGGIAGDLISSSVTTSSNNGSVSASSSQSDTSYWAAAYAGGLCGWCENSSFSSCHNSGRIVGSSSDSEVFSGGIVGYAKLSDVNGCDNAGSVITDYENTDGSSTNAKNSTAGGIVGYFVSGNVAVSFNNGAVSSASVKHGCEAGGITGRSGTNVSYSDCFNRGTVECSSPSSSQYTVVMGTAGGIIGTSQAENIVNCYNTGSLTCSAPRCESGGIAGRQTSGSLLNSYNAGQVAGTGSAIYAGGILGYSSDPFVKNCHYRSDCVTKTTYASAYGTSQTQVYMKDADFVSLLNGDASSWADDSGAENQGYPVLTAFEAAK